MPTSCSPSTSADHPLQLPRRYQEERSKGAPPVGATLHCWAPTPRPLSIGQALPSAVRPSFKRVHSIARTCAARHAKASAPCPSTAFGIPAALSKENLGTIVARWCAEAARIQAVPARHLEPDDIFVGIENGVNTFDCVAYTPRGAQRRRLLPTGRYNITNTHASRRTSRRSRGRLLHLRPLHPRPPASPLQGGRASGTATSPPSR